MKKKKVGPVLNLKVRRQTAGACREGCTCANPKASSHPEKEESKKGTALQTLPEVVPKESKGKLRLPRDKKPKARL